MLGDVPKPRWKGHVFGEACLFSPVFQTQWQGFAGRIWKVCSTGVCGWYLLEGQSICHGDSCINLMIPALFWNHTWLRLTYSQQAKTRNTQHFGTFCCFCQGCWGCAWDFTGFRGFSGLPIHDRRWIHSFEVVSRNPLDEIDDIWCGENLDDGVDDIFSAEKSVFIHNPQGWSPILGMTCVTSVVVVGASSADSRDVCHFQAPGAQAQKTQIGRSSAHFASTGSCRLFRPFFLEKKTATRSFFGVWTKQISSQTILESFFSSAPELKMSKPDNLLRVIGDFKESCTLFMTFPCLFVASIHDPIFSCHGWFHCEIPQLSWFRSTALALGRVLGSLLVECHGSFTSHQLHPIFAPTETSLRATLGGGNLSHPCPMEVFVKCETQFIHIYHHIYSIHIYVQIHMTKNS